MANNGNLANRNRNKKNKNKNNNNPDDKNQFTNIDDNYEFSEELDIDGTNPNRDNRQSQVFEEEKRNQKPNQPKISRKHN